ncbi:MAG: CoA transferase [Actinomycetota bacterium]
MVDPSWAEEDWSTYDHRIVGGEPVGIPHTEVIDALDRLCAGHTKRTLLERGREFGVTIAPINDTADLLAFDHLERRAFWRSIDLDGTGPEAGLGDGPIRFPGACVTVDGDRPADDQAAPRPVDGPPTFADRPTVAVRPDGPPPHADDTGRPFEGLLVADFSWIGVGPITAKALADHGATVVRVESANRIDALRLQVPFKDGVAGTDRSQFFASFNTSKLGLSVDLKNDGGLLLVRELVDRADVVIDSFTPGAMARLGLGPDEIRRTNPAVITVTTSLLGGGGPFSTMAGYGYHAAAIAGFFELVGWPDRPPDGPWLAYTDTIGPRFITTALLAAIDRRNRTGQGCHIEAAQLELALQLLAPELLDQQLTGTVARRLGNRARDLAPQGVYRCAGDDAWIAISVPDDAAWDRLRAALGDPPWAADAALATVEGRQAGHDAIDRELAAWTATRTEAEAERILLDAGVPAGVPNRSSDLLADPQYEHRGFYRSLDHAEVGPVPYAGHQYRIDGYDHGPRWAAPTLGQHTFEVLTEVLGFDVDRVAEIAATGCLE